MSSLQPTSQINVSSELDSCLSATDSEASSPILDNTTAIALQHANEHNLHNKGSDRQEEGQAEKDNSFARDLKPGAIKRAVFVGIAYKGTEQALQGCINDQERLYEFIKRLAPDCETRVLCDDEPAAMSVDGPPTRANILDAIRWLREGQQLWCSYSGHGSWQTDRSARSDEADNRDETIVPVDYQTAGQIVDDELRRELVDRLVDGARLTAVFDCCHSGTVLDLHCTFLDDSKYIGAKSVRRIREYVPSQWRRRLIYERHEGAKPTQNSDVCMWSGCRDTQTSADAQISGKYAGAMTHAFLHFADNTQPGHAMRANYAADPVHSPANLLQDMNGWLNVSKYDQRPQLSFGRPVNIDEPWEIFVEKKTE